MLLNTLELDDWFELLRLLELLEFIEDEDGARDDEEDCRELSELHRLDNEELSIDSSELDELIADELNELCPELADDSMLEDVELADDASLCDVYPRSSTPSPKSEAVVPASSTITPSLFSSQGTPAPKTYFTVGIVLSFCAVAVINTGLSFRLDSDHSAEK